MKQPLWTDIKLTLFYLALILLIFLLCLGFWVGVIVALIKIVQFIMGMLAWVNLG